jgi:RNA polymerase sigma-70 factor, ECF subfamily
MNAASDSSTAIPIQLWMLAAVPRRQVGEASIDEGLLARIAQGDLGAFQTFYERHAPRVVGYARKLARDLALAEDIAQEVFTSVWTRAGSFRPERGDAAGWLCALTRNKLIDHWRRASRLAATEEIDDRRLAGARSEESDLQLILRKALTRVSPEQRQAIEKAYFEGLTYQETAGELELPVGTLKSRIRLGLRVMRSFLETN